METGRMDLRAGTAVMPTIVDNFTVAEGHMAVAVFHMVAVVHMVAAGQAMVVVVIEVAAVMVAEAAMDTSIIKRYFKQKNRFMSGFSV